MEEDRSGDRHHGERRQSGQRELQDERGDAALASAA
jgi:hypothetical protein